MDWDTILGLLFFVFFVVLPLFSRAGKKGQPGKGGAGTQRPGSGPQPSGAGRQPTGAGQATTAGQGQQDPVGVTLAEIRRRVEEAQRRESERATTSRRGEARQPAPGSQRPGSLVGSDPFEGALVSVPERRLDELGGRRDGGLGPEGGLGRMGQPPQAPAPASGTGVLGREGLGPSSRAGRRTVIGREGIAGHESAGSRPPDAGLIGREGRSVLAPSVVPSTRSARRIAKAAQAEIGTDPRALDDKRPRRNDLAATLGRAEALQTDRKGIVNGLIWHEILSPPRALRSRRER